MVEGFTSPSEPFWSVPAREDYVWGPTQANCEGNQWIRVTASNSRCSNAVLEESLIAVVSKGKPAVIGQQ